MGGVKFLAAGPGWGSCGRHAPTGRKWECVFVCLGINSEGRGGRVGSGSEELELCGAAAGRAGLAPAWEWPGKEWDSDGELHPRHSFGSRGGGKGAKRHACQVQRDALGWRRAAMRAPTPRGAWRCRAISGAAPARQDRRGRPLPTFLGRQSPHSRQSFWLLFCCESRCNPSLTLRHSDGVPVGPYV